MAKLIAVHPVLNVRDVAASVGWYERLGFQLAFVDSDQQPGYAGIRRDSIEIHLQWHSEQEWADGLTGSIYRFLVDDPDGLFAEFPADLLEGTTASDTAWATREFGLYDPDRNALFFYRDL